MKLRVGVDTFPTLVTPYRQRKASMKSFNLLTGGLLALLMAGGAAAQFNTDAMKKMQKEGHKILEEQQAAEAAKAAGDAGATGTSPARRAYRIGSNFCLDARSAISVEVCSSSAASQQWAFDASRRLVAHDGRCLAGASLVTCAEGKAQKWVHDERGRLRNEAQQCLQPRNLKAGAPVIAAACGMAPTQVWIELAQAG